MRYKFLLLIFCVYAMTAFAQSNIKLHGYVQDVLPGNIPKGTTEDGKNLEGRHTNVNYILYLEAPAKNKPLPVEIWIKGERFAVQSKKINTFPVVISKGDNKASKSLTLYPASHNLLKLSVVQFTEGKSFSKAKSKASSNDVVLVYQLNGKYDSVVLKKLTRIEPEMND